ncbi:MAG TPA: tRNA (N(6)-L-threonylcarbamoyladenosine(37)-C(2))-methylthiotransferase MtaB [Bacteroidaceae bacterium]|nr:tRNA (N(6)-L-threonylcarbamoyladenosine(37)-C(2))-methylthiotransferase MtaB [Bacteroidaceae bacterium]
MKSVSFKTLGCRLNQYETDALVTDFEKAGYRIVDFSEPADISVINTCTVTSHSDQKSRNIISQAISRNSNALIVVTGCMVENLKNELVKNKNIAYLVDNRRKSQIVSLIDGHYKGEIIDPDTLPGDVFGFKTVHKSFHTRTAVKIQDGCDNFCTFCIVPFVRGRAVSRPLHEITDNVRRVLDNGFRELVITGVNIGKYNYEGFDFEHVLEHILEIQGDFRVRISSLEPYGFGKDFHRLFEHPKLAPHLHLCLQSGSEQILQKMRRMYTVKSFVEIIERFRNQMPDFNFTTDIIVGFPGETEEDFAETCRIAEELQFGHIHTFRYSRRTGTRADRMPDQVPEEMKIRRSEIIRSLSEKSRRIYLSRMLGKSQTVLIEQIDKRGLAHGYGEHYIPVIFKPVIPEKNRFEKVVLNKISQDNNALA